MEDVDMENDPDPIKASYEVFIKPYLSADKQMYVLQFPNRDARQNYSKKNAAEPLKMRIKPKAGMVELDVPMDVRNNYDQRKGATWGSAIKKSAETKGAGSHGLPGGFGIGGAPPPGGRGRGARVIEDVRAVQDQILEDFENAIQREQVLVKQTLGGQAISNEETTPQYMIGTFLNDQLHLTPVDNVVQMRPQFHHIDAQSEQERAIRGRDAALGARTAPEARVVHMTVKSTIDGEEATTESMDKRIQDAQSEAWKSHRFVDEDAEETWIGYNANLFVGAGGTEIDEELLDKVPRLSSTLNNAEYMNAISAPNDAAKLSRNQKLKKAKGKGKEKATEADEAESDDLDAMSDPSLSDTDSEAEDGSLPIG
ncbi:uncharacterized protein L3040_004774 [Drepanopeziza brunnea f. sp. 'multigermtubi']|uniref:uncharacterized protein n=1 Tax=Drepanopeziza brunnea f. sp. 'multigermtubi' TaxID=698441 RepID=UPI00238D9462|nr:hypothetical protein L3040_004774 [Drepanopeziza brunnea f. sp. 'multigermtubi']